MMFVNLFLLDLLPAPNYGVDGTGLSLLLHHQRLGEIFDIWCLHIPTTDRTPFIDLVKLVERTITSENYHTPNRPIYLVGESIGACLALAVAACLPHIDLVLVLANPVTSSSKSQLQPLLSTLKIMPCRHIRRNLPYMINLITGVPAGMVMFEKGLLSQQTVTDLSETVASLFSYLSDLGDVLTTNEVILWKLKMLESACAYSNSRLHAVTNQTLILCSGNDQLLPSIQEGERLQQILQNNQIRTFSDCSHALFLEKQFDLVTVIKGTGFYRHARHTDASDFVPPSVHEIKQILDSGRWLDVATCPVMLSTLENGKIVRSLSGIPSEGPVLFVGYHNMLGLEVSPMIRRFIREKKINIRGVAHPMLFKELRIGGKRPDPTTPDVLRLLGTVPVSSSNLYKLFSIKAHILLYPGGLREALHRKGEEYKLFWPEQSEFVRMAARFGATIVPFGAVGEDDYAHLVLDYDDQMKIPFLKDYIKEISDKSMKIRNEMKGNNLNLDLHMPVLLPKVPGRYYYLFGKPIRTEGWSQELTKNREKSHQLYMQVKKEVEKCLDYCKGKREYDPYRNIITRFMYQATHGLDSEVPTFYLD